MVRPDLFAPALPDARPIFAKTLSRRMSERIRRNISGGLRRFLVLSVSVGELLAQAIRRGAGYAAIRLQGARGRHREAVPASSALWRPGGRRQLFLPGRGAVEKRVSGFADAAPAAGGHPDFRVWQLRPTMLPGCTGVSAGAGSVSRSAAAGLSLRGGDP